MSQADDSDCGVHCHMIAPSGIDMAASLSERISKRRFLRLVPLGAAASAIAACTPAAPASTTQAPAQAAGAATPAAQAAPATAAAAKKGGTFTYAEAGRFNNLNPCNFSRVNLEK